jgi:hypothetical protein
MFNTEQRVVALLENILSVLVGIRNLISGQVSKGLADLQAQVTQNSNVEQSAMILIRGIAAEISAAIARQRSIAGTDGIAEYIGYHTGSCGQRKHPGCTLTGHQSFAEGCSPLGSSAL